MSTTVRDIVSHLECQLQWRINVQLRHTWSIKYSGGYSLIPGVSTTVRDSLTPPSSSTTVWVSTSRVLIPQYSFYATLVYIRHFIFAGCYDNNPWYLVTNLAGHLDLAGFFFLYAPLILNAPLNLLLGTKYRPAFSFCDGGSPSLNIFYLPGLEHAPP
jgi:hypothetical protein